MKLKAVTQADARPPDEATPGRQEAPTAASVSTAETPDQQARSALTVQNTALTLLAVVAAVLVLYAFGPLRAFGTYYLYARFAVFFVPLAYVGVRRAVRKWGHSPFPSKRGQA